MVFLLKLAEIRSFLMSVCFSVWLFSSYSYVCFLFYPFHGHCLSKHVSKSLSVTKNSQILSKYIFLRWKEERGFVSKPNERMHVGNVSQRLSWLAFKYCDMGKGVPNVSASRSVVTFIKCKHLYRDM